LASSPLRVGERPVRDGHAGDAHFVQMLGDPLDRVSGAEQQGPGLREAREDLLRHDDGGVRDGDRVATDIGVGAHAFGGGQGDLREQVELGAEGPGRARHVVGGFDLPHDLRLAQHLRVETGCDADQMPCRLLVPVAVGHARQLAHAHLPGAGKPVGHRGFVCGLERKVELGAVAGGENGGFGHARNDSGRFLECARQRFFRERDAFPDLDGGGAIIDAVCQYGHHMSVSRARGAEVRCLAELSTTVV
jgi:hypothetical protein